VTTDPPSLLQGDAASQWRFTLCGILNDALRVVQQSATSSGPAQEHEVERALQLIRDVAAELRQLGDEEPVPF